MSELQHLKSFIKFCPKKKFLQTLSDQSLWRYQILAIYQPETETASMVVYSLNGFISAWQRGDTKCQVLRLRCWRDESLPSVSPARRRWGWISSPPPTARSRGAPGTLRRGIDRGRKSMSGPLLGSSRVVAKGVGGLGGGGRGGADGDTLLSYK